MGKLLGFGEALHALASIALSINCGRLILDIQQSRERQGGAKSVASHIWWHWHLKQSEGCKCPRLRSLAASTDSLDDGLTQKGSVAARVRLVLRDRCPVAIG